jgi:hypothetical protein
MRRTLLLFLDLLCDILRTLRHPLCNRVEIQYIGRSALASRACVISERVNAISEMKVFEGLINVHFVVLMLWLFWTHPICVISTPTQ